MKLLCIESATEACSAAVYADGRIFERFELAPQRHAELILSLCEAVLNEARLRAADLDGLAVGRGPGAFTGVRIAIGVIQGMSLGTGLKVACVSTLEALALGVRREHAATRIVAAIDARMGEVYSTACAIGANGLPVIIVPEGVARPEAIAVPEGRGWVGAGSGFSAHRDALLARLGGALSSVLPDCHPHAQDVASLALDVFAHGTAVDAEHALPVYVRDRVVEPRTAPEVVGKH